MNMADARAKRNVPELATLTSLPFVKPAKASVLFDAAYNKVSRTTNVKQIIRHPNDRPFLRPRGKRALRYYADNNIAVLPIPIQTMRQWQKNAEMSCI